MQSIGETIMGTRAHYGHRISYLHQIWMEHNHHTFAKVKWNGNFEKNDWSNFYPFNRSIALWWVAGLVFLVLYTFFKFYVCKPTNLPMPEKENVTLSPVHKVNGTISKGDKELNKTLWSQVNFSVFLKRVENCYIQRPCTNLEHS